MGGGILYRLDAWETAVLLLVILVAAWGFGWRSGRMCRRRGDEGASKVDEASLALMGLLLGFSFAVALDKHGTRREMVILDSNSIGDFYTAASMLRQPIRGQLQKVARDYADFRLQQARRGSISEAEVDDLVAKVNSMHAQMTELVRQAVEAGTPADKPLIETLNNLTSSHAARMAAARDRLPWSIVLLLLCSTVISIGLLGRGQGLKGELRVTSTLAFILLISFVFYLIIDLNQPQRGLVRVSQEPLERLLKAMEP